MTRRYLLYSKKQSKLFSHRHFQKAFKAIFQTLLRTDTRVILKSLNETFSNPLTLEKQTFWKHNEQVSKSPWITMDRKGGLSNYYKSKDHNSSSSVNYSTIPSKLLWNLDPTRCQFNFDSPVEQRTTETPELVPQEWINTLHRVHNFPQRSSPQQNEDPQWKHSKQSLKTHILFSSSPGFNKLPDICQGFIFPDKKYIH